MKVGGSLVKRRLILSCVMATVSFLCANSVSASNWYVRSGAACSVNGNGTTSSCAASAGAAGAWSGFSNIAWSSIAGGDSLFLNSGDTYVGTLGVGSSGSSGNPITISVTGGGTARINANGTNGINFNGHSYVTVDGAIGSPAFGGSTTMGISVTNIGASGFCAYENSGGHHFKLLHIECYGTSPGTSQPDDNRGGFYLSAGGSGKGGVEVAYNYIHGPVQPAFSNSKWGATCVTVWAATGTSNLTDNLQHDNRCDQVYNDGLRCAANCSIYHNEVSHVDASGHSDSLLIQSGSYTAVYGNYVHDSYDQNIYFDNLFDSACGHVRIYNNIINSPGGHGGINIDPEGGAGTAGSGTGCVGSSAAWDDVVIANNTFYQSSTYNVFWSGRGAVTNLAVLNNIFGQVSMGGGAWYSIYLGSGPSFATGDRWDYNVYSTTSSGYPTIAHTSSNYVLAGLQALIPAREAHGKTGSPSFTNPTSGDFHLTASDAVAKSAALNLALVYPFLQTDADGKQRSLTGAWDLGAYAVSSGSQLNPPANLTVAVVQ
jgi:hypothetical protein